MSDSPSNDLIERAVQTLRDDSPGDAAIMRHRVMAKVAGGATSRWGGPTLAAGVAVAVVAVVALISSGGGNPTAAGVLFQLEAPEAASVTMAGDFNDWDPKATPLTREADGGRWSVRLPLARGTYRYAFLIDGRRWVADPNARSLADDFGGSNSLVTVGAGE